jgi:hypothetical protein
MGERTIASQTVGQQKTVRFTSCDGTQFGFIVFKVHDLILYKKILHYYSTNSEGIKPDGDEKNEI